MDNVRLLALIVGMGLTGCGGAESQPSGPGSSPDSLTFDTGDFQAPAGDSFECFYTNVKTDHEINVTNAKGKQGPGGHHVIIYYTDVPREPTHHPCVDAEMVSWHQIAGADTNKEPVVAIPAGAAVKVPAGKQMVIQSHYINTTGATEKVNDTITLDTVDAKDVKQFINFWALVDLGFQIPANGAGKSVTTCTVTEDLNSVALLGHMHEYGKHFKLEAIDDKGASLSTIYDHDWAPQYVSHPPLISSPLDKPLLIKAGTRVRQTCEWDNTTPDAMAFPREMCVSFVFYYPDKGFIECDGEPEASP
jgi:Copper type II ascorbate-dependent monooxygenase, C-terminal domain